MPSASCRVTLKIHKASSLGRRSLCMCVASQITETRKKSLFSYHRREIYFYILIFIECIKTQNNNGRTENKRKEVKIK